MDKLVHCVGWLPFVLQLRLQVSLLPFRADYTFVNPAARPPPLATHATDAHMFNPYYFSYGALPQLPFPHLLPPPLPLTPSPLSNPTVDPYVWKEDLVSRLFVGLSVCLSVLLFDCLVDHFVSPYVDVGLID